MDLREDQSFNDSFDKKEMLYKKIDELKQFKMGKIKFSAILLLHFFQSK